MDKNIKKDPSTGIKEFFKKWPKLYYFVYDYLGPIYFGGLGATNFLKKYSVQGKVYNLGSGTRVIAEGVINVDSTAYASVDIVTDITNMAIPDNDAGGIICEEVLEHVQEPDSAIREIHRILMPGGYAYITAPFLYPYHAAPDDYTRWTHIGLKRLLSEFEIVELGIRSGPFSTLTVNTAYFLATLFSFGSVKLYWILVYFFSILLFPIKFLDSIGNKLPHAINMSSVLYCVVRKRQ